MQPRFYWNASDAPEAERPRPKASDPRFRGRERDDARAKRHRHLENLLKENRPCDPYDNLAIKMALPDHGEVPSIGAL